MNWNLLLKRMKRGKAVLLLGPEVIMSQHSDNTPLKETLLKYIQENLEDILEEEELKRIEYYSEDGFFFLEDSYRLEVVESILTFYESQKVGELYKKLAQLPFHLTLSLSPDKLLGQAFEAQGMEAHFHFYDKKNYNASQDEKLLDFKPSLENRLIYNVFGSIDNEDSLILSYDDLFEFLQRIFNNYKLPKAVEEAIFEANCFVFLGFNYGKWYLKLLLRLMKMHEEVRRNFAMDEPLNPQIETFFVNEFNMNFTRLNTIQFIDELYQKCGEEGILIQSSAPKSTKLPSEEYEKAFKTLRSGNLDQLIGLLNQQKAMPNTYTDSLALLEAKYKQYKSNKAKGLLSQEQITLQLNRISNDFLLFLKEFRPGNTSKAESG